MHAYLMGPWHVKDGSRCCIQELKGVSRLELIKGSYRPVQGSYTPVLVEIANRPRNAHGPVQVAPRGDDSVAEGNDLRGVDLEFK